MFEWIRTNFYLGNVLVFGLAALVLGGVALWVAVRSEKRPIRDAIALLLGGLILTCVMVAIIWWMSPTGAPSGTQKMLGEAVLLCLALGVSFLGNRFARHGKKRR